jgi:gamma-tubulin complex component 3
MFDSDLLKPTTAAENIPRVLRRVREYSTSFSERAQGIVHSLQTHPDLDCRFLAVRLSFSDYYKSRKELRAEMESNKTGATTNTNTNK